MSTLHRFIVDDIALKPGPLALSAHDFPELFHQLTRVLRAKPGATCLLLDGKGTRAHGTIVTITKKEVALEMTQVETQEESGIRLSLGLPLLKLSHVETAISMCTQLGVDHFFFVQSDHTVKEQLPLLSSTTKQTRLCTLAREACEQSERLYLPSFDFAIHPLRDLRLDETFCVAVERQQKKEPVMVTGQNIRTLLIGPEGGWSEKEKTLFQTKRVSLLDLGSTILRAETAAVVGSFKVLNNI